LEDRLAKSQIEFDGTICRRYEQGEPIDPNRVPNMPEIARLQIDLMAMAFACDVTRVASLMWTQSTAGHLYNWLGDDIREGHHSLAHKGDEDTPKIEQNTRINNWH